MVRNVTTVLLYDLGLECAAVYVALQRFADALRSKTRFLQICRSMVLRCMQVFETYGACGIAVDGWFGSGDIQCDWRSRNYVSKLSRMTEELHYSSGENCN